MNVPDKVPLNLADKPNLQKLMKEQPDKAKEIMAVFGALMEESVEKEWIDLPQLFARGKEKLTFSDLIKGVLHGCLDLPAMNPEMYEVLKEEVHPFSMFGDRKNYLKDRVEYRNWRAFYNLPDDIPLNANTIAKIIRISLRYYRYVDIESLKEALVNNQVANWRGLNNPNMIANLPFVPALRYQQQHFGDLHVGKFFDEIGSFDCGAWPEGQTNQCPACKVSDVYTLENYHICLDCNGGWKVEAK